MKPKTNNTRAMACAGQHRDLCMRMVRLLRSLFILALLLAFVSVPRIPAQQRTGTNGSSSGNIAPPSLDPDPMDQVLNMHSGGESLLMYEKRMKALNVERQRSMVNDANKLLKLTTELNEEVNGAHPQPLNSDQLRMVAEIEKLAKSVRDKMSTPVRGSSPMFIPPYPVPLIGIP